MKKLLLPVLFFISNLVSAQFTTNAAVNTTVIDQSVYEEAVPIAVQGKQGNTLITYFNNNSSGTYEFSMQTLDKNGNYVIGPNGASVSTYPQSTSVTIYDSKADDEGNVVSAFADIRTGNLDITGYRMSPTGGFLWPNTGVALNDPLAAGGVAPNVGILTNGDAIISWTADGSPKDWVCFQRISPLGVTAYGTPMRIIDSTGAAGCAQSQVIPMQNGDFMIIYTKQTGFFPPICNMYMQRFDIAGQPVWAQPVHISTKTISAFALPSVISDGNNGAYIAFSSSSPNGTILNDVYLQHIDENGILWSTMGTEACTGMNSQRLSPVVCFENGMPYPVVLIKETDLGQSSAGVTIQAFDMATGSALWSPNGIAVTQMTAAVDEPYDIRSMCGALIILYAEGLFGNNTLYATKVDYNGATMWSPATVTLSSVASNKLRGQLTPEYNDGAGGSQVVAVWEDERNGRGVYAQNISCDGVLGPLTSSVNTVTRPALSAGVFPNPSSTMNQRLTIYSESIEQVSIELVDAAGRTIGKNTNLLLANGMNEFNVSDLFVLQNLVAGIYTLQLQGKNNNGFIKLVLQK